MLLLGELTWDNINIFANDEKGNRLLRLALQNLAQLNIDKWNAAYTAKTGRPPPAYVPQQFATPVKEKPKSSYWSYICSPAAVWGYLSGSWAGEAAAAHPGVEKGSPASCNTSRTSSASSETSAITTISAGTLESTLGGVLEGGPGGDERGDSHSRSHSHSHSDSDSDISEGEDSDGAEGEDQRSLLLSNDANKK